MNTKLTWVCAAALCLLGAGCELDNTEQVRLDITPREATVRKGESVELQAFGWHSYHWTLEDATLGYLSAKTGDATLYTSITTNSATQIITVSVSPGGTNSWDVAASAIVTHEADD